MSALRLARARTGRSKILKFNGGYHGHEDALLVEAGSGLANQGIALSAGVHPEYAASTLVAEFTMSIRCGSCSRRILVKWPR